MQKSEMVDSNNSKRALLPSVDDYQLPVQNAGSTRLGLNAGNEAILKPQNP